MNTPTLPELPEPWTAASAIKCAACGSAYVPARFPSAMAAGALFQPVMSHACKCGSTSFTAAIGYDSPSPAIYTAEQMRAYALAALSSALPQPDSGHQAERSADTPAPEPSATGDAL